MSEVALMFSLNFYLNWNNVEVVVDEANSRS